VDPTFCFMHGYGANKKKHCYITEIKKSSTSIYISFYVLGRFYYLRTNHLSLNVTLSYLFADVFTS
jgi:hypothetical protein